MNELDRVVSEINKKFKTTLVTKGTERMYVEKIPFSSPRLNYLTYGGVPLGKATELFGGEGGGKTTTALDITTNAQKMANKEFEGKIKGDQAKIADLKKKGNKGDQKQIGQLEQGIVELQERGPRRVVYVDAENTLDEDWARLNGVDLNELYLIKPDEQTAEQVLQMIMDLIDSGMVIALVLDSVPMLVSQNLFDQEMSKKSYGGIAGAVTEFCRKVSSKLSKHHTALVLINQVRQDFNNPYNKYNTPGGQALKHLYALRLFFRKGTFIDDNNGELKNSTEDPRGNLVDVTIVKTKVCKPDRRVGFYTLKYFTGIDVLADTVDMAVKYGFLTQSGAWYYCIDAETGEILKSNNGELKFQGRAKLLTYLQEDEDMFQELYEAVHEKVLQTN